MLFHKTGNYFKHTPRSYELCFIGVPFKKCMIQNIYLYFSKAWDANLPMMSSKWMASFQKCMHCTKPSPSMLFERLFSWICYEMWVDKYENMNIESIYSILLYELTRLICWLKAYSSKLLCVPASVQVCVCVCVCVCAECLGHLKCILQRGSSLRKHPPTSRLHKHTCIT